MRRRSWRTCCEHGRRSIAALDRGEIRVAERDGDDWVVNEEAKAAILDYFRERKMEPIELGPFEYHDKIPLKLELRRARACASSRPRSPGTARSSPRAS